MMSEIKWKTKWNQRILNSIVPRLKRTCRSAWTERSPRRSLGRVWCSAIACAAARAAYARCPATSSDRSSRAVASAGRRRVKTRPIRQHNSTRSFPSAANQPPFNPFELMMTYSSILITLFHLTIEETHLHFIVSASLSLGTQMLTQSLDWLPSTRSINFINYIVYAFSFRMNFQYSFFV